MDIYKSKFTRLQREIFTLLCLKSGDKMSKRGIAKLLGVSATAVGKALPALVKEGIAIEEKAPNFDSVSLNRSQAIMQLKRAENLRLIYESGLAQFLEDAYPGCAVSLFGSFSRGDDTSKSDIDVAAIGLSKKDADAGQFEKIFGRKININKYESWKSIHKNLKESICNGITLSGGIEL